MRMQGCTFKSIADCSENRGHARAYVTPLERTCRQGYPLERQIPRSSVLQKYWMGEISARRTLDARSSLRHMTPLERPILRSSAQSSARADCKTVQRYWMLGFHARASLSPLERKCRIWKTQIAPPSSNQVLITQNSTSWAEFPENICKHIE